MADIVQCGAVVQNDVFGTNGKDIVAKLLEGEATRDISLMAALLADDFVYETPFALPGAPARVEGKAAFTDMLEQFIGKNHGIYITWAIYNVRIYSGGEPGLFFAEMDALGVVAQNGYQYRQSYISLFQVTDGYVSFWREYFNPIPLQEALGFLEHSGGDKR
ncbi:nuclear transport factor 2 family protein [Brevibacillus borstelensis]|uniref:nuclear transport factor 2 family protein n=1 Tax=Brevibacillus borstelensis TaxID=45462 RepID=UPI0030BCB7C8